MRSTIIFEERMGVSRWMRIARFRLKNEIRKKRYWEKEKEKECRLCGRERETWKHLGKM